MTPLNVLFLAASLVPVVAMLAALFAAVWIREGKKEESGAVAPLSFDRD